MFEGIDLSKLDLGSIMSDIEKKTQEMKVEASKKTYTAKSGGGMVEASINGNSELIDINIDDSLLEDKESLQILLISAINEALKMAETDKKNSALNMLGGFNPFGANNS